MLWPAKMAPAIGTPLARLFFDPQKVMVISSSFLKPSKTAAEHGDAQHERQEHDVDADDDGNIAQRKLMPDAFHDGVTEGEIDDHQN